MKINAVMLFMLISTFCEGQINSPEIREYYYQANKLRYFLHERNKDSAMHYVDLISYSKVPISTFSYTNIAQAYYLNGDSIDGNKWVQKSITEEGFNSPKNLEYNFRAYTNIASEPFQTIIANYDNIVQLPKKFPKKYNTEHIRLITEIYEEDQQDRAEAEFIFDTTNVFVRKMEVNDLRHFRVLDSLFRADENFPNLSNLDYKSVSNIFFMLIHLYQYFDMEAVLKRFDVQINKGLFPNYYTPVLIDKMLSYDRMQAKYGIFQNSRNQSEYKQIQDIRIVDSLRAGYCLPPLYIDAKMQGLNLPSGYTYDAGKW